MTSSTTQIRKTPDFKISIELSNRWEAEHAKVLGLEIDSNFSWGFQVDQMGKKISSGLHSA